MRTDDLIQALAADLPSREAPTGRRLAGLLPVALVGAAALFAVTLGIRPDVAEAIRTVRYPAKFVMTLALVAAAWVVLMRLARPTGGAVGDFLPLAVPVLVLAGAVGLELATLDPAGWRAAAVGHNSLVCMGAIPMLSALPLAATLAALRRAAPGSPTRAGAAAGLLSAGLGATLYAAHCPDDSPLFLAIWYVIAIAAVTGIGAALGRRLLAW